MAKAKLYSLYWANPISTSQSATPVQLNLKNTIDKKKFGVPAAILYPAFMTPDIVWGDEKFELIIAFKQKEDIEFLRMHVNQQLKIRGGLNMKRRFSSSPLFDGDLEEKIAITELGEIGTDQIATESRFKGILDKRAKDLYKKEGFKYLYAVAVDGGMRESADRGGKWVRVNGVKEDGTIEVTDLDDNQDAMIHDAIKVDKLDKVSKEFKKGQYGFEVGESGDRPWSQFQPKRDVKAGAVDKTNPVQCHHPVFYYKKLKYAGVGHMADVHASARQQVIERSPAKVIEMPDESFEEIGNMVNIASADAASIFSSFRADKDVDLVVIGGDLVDFILNTWPPAPGKEAPKVKDVWDICEMKKHKHYGDNVDFLSMYSLVTDFYDSASPKPTYVVTGNHDCYSKAYGISPRVMGTKANEGIPADHNLTIYEAILAFGKTYAEIMKSFNFDKDKLKWFYTVYTPFADFSLNLPKQCIVGLGWGEEEVMLSAGRLNGQTAYIGGFIPYGGHLPRAPDAMSSKQLKLLKKTVDERDGRNVILTTHFTFASYAESISNKRASDPKWGNENDQGDVYYTGAWYSTRDFSKADMGTFEKHREDVYKKLIVDQRAIQIVLTGHSHRRGFYTARRADLHGNNSVKTGFHDFPEFENGKPKLKEAGAAGGVTLAADQKAPWIILSDSGGSVPRMNLEGEFHGWGSDSPGGTKIAFDKKGNVKNVEAVRTSVQPRFAVAVDYTDVMVGSVMKFKTPVFDKRDELKDDFRHEFVHEFNEEHMNETGAKVLSVTLYNRTKKGEWSKIKLDKSREAQVPGKKLKKTYWRMPSKEAKEIFRTKVAKNKSRGAFMSIQLGSDAGHLNRYDFSTPWTFEIEVDRDWEGWNKTSYEFERDSTHKEVPDLSRRKKYPGYK